MFCCLPVFAWSACNVDLVLSKPNAIYIDHGNGVVSDKETGLMWQKCSVGQYNASCSGGSAQSYNWLEAHNAVITANMGAGLSGFNDWRLPNHKELFSLVEVACSPTINATSFPLTQASNYWSSSPALWSAAGLPGNPRLAITVLFMNGSEVKTLEDAPSYVRLVRDDS